MNHLFIPLLNSLIVKLTTMSDTNIDLLSCHPTNMVVNQRNESYSGKDKFRNTKPIPGAKLRVHTVYERGEYRGVSWDALLPSLDDDYLRLDAPTNMPNPRAAWMLDVEADGADYFKQEISAPVLSKFTEYPELFN
ncbi:hypothetical protein LZ31DRAFT_160006 [Colletotrichum somersetense]|nr:hypothetical protein LZ31DRAFT_160006 [Colletotrichum somersetense]